MKHLISGHEVISSIYSNDKDSSDDSGLSNPSLLGEKMADEYGEVKRPQTKKKKSSQVSDAIRDIDADQILAAEKIQ